MQDQLSLAGKHCGAKQVWNRLKYDNVDFPFSFVKRTLARYAQTQSVTDSPKKPPPRKLSLWPKNPKIARQIAQTPSLYFKNLFHSMPGRVQAGMETRGGYIGSPKSK